jgi:type II secretory pathway component PulF
VTLRQRIRFYQQLAVLARSGVPLRTSLHRMRDRISARETALLAEKVDAGAGIAEAFVAAGFSPFECHLVAAGERSAQLDSIFEHLSEFWSKQREMKQDLISQLYYPLTVMHLALFVAALGEMVMGSWEQVEIALAVYFACFYAISFLIFVVVRVSWRSDLAQRFWLWVPIIGRTLSTAFAYRWIMAMRIEYHAGVTLSSAVADAWRASGFVGSERLAVEGRQAMLEGTQLSALVRNWRRLPSDWVDFLETGEISGQLEKAFENLEAEAGRAYSRAQKRMNEWVPKIASFLILLIIGTIYIHTVYRAYIVPIQELEKSG